MRRDWLQLRRPELGSGRPRKDHLLRCGILFAVALYGSSARGHELLSWWSRDLLSISLEPGEWVEVESLENSQGEAFTDTLRCDVLAADGKLRWIRLAAARGVEEWFVQIDTSLLRSAESVLELVTRLYRRDHSGVLRSESVEELNQSAVARGRLRDPFSAPSIERSALPDSVVQGRTLRREQVVLHEASERRIPLGRQNMLYRQTLHSRATLSPDVPIFGLLASETLHAEQTERFGADGRPLGAPSADRNVRSWLRCLRYGRGAPQGLPKGL